MPISNLILPEEKGGKWLFLLPVYGVEIDSSAKN